MGNQIPTFFRVALLAVMLEEESGYKPHNPEYIQLWDNIEHEYKLLNKNKSSCLK